VHYITTVRVLPISHLYRYADAVSPKLCVNHVTLCLVIDIVQQTSTDRKLILPSDLKGHTITMWVQSIDLSIIADASFLIRSIQIRK